MTTPDAEDASPSPEYSGDQDGSEMADQKDQRASSDAPSTNNSTANTTTTTTKPNAKDPLRPRRKKARRACFACQRAHLTCGDERPCQRCIKRGLQDACHDGVRKKAKYLHDAPPEALMPGVGGHYPHLSNAGQQHGAASVPNNAQAMGQPNNFYPQQQQANYNNQQSNPSAMQDFGGIPFDPSDPALFNFDLASLNFGNHYENNSVMNPLNQAANLYNGPMSTASGSSENLGISTGGFGFNDGIPTADWQPHSRQGSAAQIQTPNNTPATGNLDHQLRQQEGQNGMPLAYAVGAGPGSMASASPGSTMADGQNFEPTSFSSPAYMANQHSHQEEQRRQQIYNRQQQLHNQRTQQHQQHQQQQEANRKRRRDPSEIYDSVTGPYPYTDGFHGLIALLKQRFSIAKRSRIAQALASIRPSFIACTSTLNTDDLIFMEKSFQRTLYQYEDFINAHAVPTIICRRTGQIAAVSQEFSLLTGWKKDVLLGYEPNQNVNTGGSSGSAIQSGTATGTRGVNTPREQQPNIDSPRPVYLAEILDDNSVCQFYEDFAKLAFVAPRATATRSCKLIRYRTKDDLSNLENMNIKSEESGNKDQSKGTRYMNGNTVVKLEGGAGAGRPGDKDGLINCMFCWSVKRDVFEVPMLIVMNFLPIME
ncbi:Transcription factor [Lasiodiplodia theobromae]|uniref:Transcription factor n=1 Tax=Lasiodiplodia theobromae TaxID=45133 RepID=UPI0015C38153|nr:Transcription factor [Lasiodiplodia theobromae]KAF4543190.1 Transcription factor [Lasiodiplodia theobromae]